MSLSYSVKTAVDNIIHEFIQTVATKYDLDASELLLEWEGQGQTHDTVVTTNQESTNELDPEKLLKYKVPELKALCKKRGVKTTGKKEELISALLKPADLLTPAKVKSTKVKSPVTSTVVKKLANATTVQIRRNAHGNHEHPETGFVFDTKTKKVKGKQNDDGCIQPLTEEDIDECNKYKFAYILPDNLDNNKTAEEHVEELDDDEIIDSDEDVELDEEELIESEEEEEEEAFEEDFE